MPYHLHTRFMNVDWFKELIRYNEDRFSHIESLLVDTFRYVQPNLDNGKVYSYEFSSILRDAGGTFSSILDELVKKSKFTTKRKPDIMVFRDFLLKKCIGISKNRIIFIPLSTDYIVPLKAFSEPKVIPDW